jgi:mannose-6-phosphate isomerase-like protein (cupin superfamily)
MKKKYTFSSYDFNLDQRIDEGSESDPSEKEEEVSLLEEDDADKYVQQFFTKRPATAVIGNVPSKPLPPTQTVSNPRSAPFAATTSTTTTTKSSGNFSQIRRVRPKPDLGSDAEEDNEINVSNQVLLRMAAKAPAKELPPQIRKKQREMSEQNQLLTQKQEKERREFLQAQREEKKRLEEAQLKDKYWMGEILQNARKSMDDRGAGGKKVILRKDTLKESALIYEQGKHAFHSAFVSYPKVSAGRFYLEPRGAKKTEMNSEDTVLYLTVEKTGGEGLTVRIDKKYFELFDGDCAIVPPGVVYSVLNPSRTTLSTFSYMLIDVEQESSSSRAPPPLPPSPEPNEDDILNYDFRNQHS